MLGHHEVHEGNQSHHHEQKHDAGQPRDLLRHVATQRRIGFETSGNRQPILRTDAEGKRMRDLGLAIVANLLLQIDHLRIEAVVGNQRLEFRHRIGTAARPFECAEQAHVGQTLEDFLPGPESSGRQHVEARIQNPSHLNRRRHDAGKLGRRHTGDGYGCAAHDMQQLARDVRASAIAIAPQRVAENDGRLPFGRCRQTPSVRLHAQNVEEIPWHPNRRQLPSRPIRQTHRWLATPARQRLPIEPLQLRHTLGDVPHIGQGNILKVPVRRLPPHRDVLPIRHPRRQPKPAGVRNSSHHGHEPKRQPQRHQQINQLRRPPPCQPLNGGKGLHRP